MTGILRNRFDAFRILGLAPQATQADVRHAFRRLAFATHPDRLGGQEEQFAEVRAAYEMLRGAVEGPAAARPARPSVEVRVAAVPEEMQAACRALLESWGGAGGHAPIATRRRGRHVTYLVPTPLARGINTVGVPVGDLDDPRRVAPRIVEVTSACAGAGAVDLSPQVVADHFPGARSVRIEFGRA